MWPSVAWPEAMETQGLPREKIDVSPQKNGYDVRIDVVSLKSGVLGESFDVYSDAPQ